MIISPLILLFLSKLKLKIEKYSINPLDAKGLPKVSKIYYYYRILQYVVVSVQIWSSGLFSQNLFSLPEASTFCTLFITYKRSQRLFATIGSQWSLWPGDTFENSQDMTNLNIIILPIYNSCSYAEFYYKWSKLAQKGRRYLLLVQWSRKILSQPPGIQRVEGTFVNFCISDNVIFNNSNLMFV